MNRRSGKDSKKNILNAAQKVFSKFGYRGASMRTIAYKAGISVGGLYLYFRNKEELCLTLMKERLDEISNKTEITLEGIDSPIDAISTYIKIHFKYVKRDKKLILTESREQGFEFGLDLKGKFFKKQIMFVEKIIKKGINTGDFGECNVKGVAKIIMGALRGFVFSIIVDTENSFSPEECSKFILSGLLRRSDK